MSVDEPQVLVQYSDGHRMLCRGVAGLPVPAPAQIGIVSSNSAHSTLAEDLGERVLQSILRSATGAREVLTPCGGRCVGLTGCYAHGNPTCRQVLVLLGEGPDPSHVPPQWTTLVGEWMHNANGLILPVLPAGSQPVKWLPPGVARINSTTWHRSPRECIPAVLTRAGLVPDEWRVFISYRRNQAAGIAEQLFDELTHRGWNVFLDRFQIPPGIEFQARLSDELRDKAMVVFLETPDIRRSVWTRLEMMTAYRLRLWTTAVNLPKGDHIAGLAGGRIHVGQAEVIGSGQTATLTKAECERVVNRLVDEHTRGVMWRRRYMDDLIYGALGTAGVPPDPASVPGTIRVSPPPTEFVIRTSPYPPDVRQFIDADRERAATPACNVLVGPTALREADRVERIRWLGEKADVRVVDEAAVLAAARAIKAGALP